MLGILVAHHCNLSCKGCSNLSSRLKKFFVAPYAVARDLSMLARVYDPECIVLNGGEPLLHPDLIEVIDAVRGSGISQYVKVVTNGILLSRMPREFWQRVDEVVISLYPTTMVDHEKIKTCHRKAKEHGVRIVLRYSDIFREKFAELGTSDHQLVQRIYRTCQTTHFWRCHILCDGHFFRCPQGALIPKVIESVDAPDTFKDGVRISGDNNLLGTIKRYLSSKRPLNSCYRCLGTSGKEFLHVQEPSSAAQLPRTTEESISWQNLSK